MLLVTGPLLVAVVIVVVGSRGSSLERSHSAPAIIDLMGERVNMQNTNVNLTLRAPVEYVKPTILTLQITRKFLPVLFLNPCLMSVGLIRRFSVLASKMWLWVLIGSCDPRQLRPAGQSARGASSYPPLVEAALG
jgi:hypothetical protein